MKHLLFICGKNRLRSPTAENIFSSIESVEVDSAGVNSDAECVLSSEQVLWADIIFVMEKSHHAKLKSKFTSELKGKKVVCLGIQDDYKFMQKELVELLNQKVSRYLQ